MKKINTICVIDDDEIYTFTIKRIIAKAGIAEKSIFFKNGKAALDFFIENARNTDELPELILLDINMPVLDGWQFMDRFVKLAPRINKNIAIYIVSSSDDREDYDKAKAISEITDFAVKPINVETLQNMVYQLNLNVA